MNAYTKDKGNINTYNKAPNTLTRSCRGNKRMFPMNG